MRKNNDALIWFDVDAFQEALDAAIGETEVAVKKAIGSTMGRVRGKARTLMSAIIREKWNIQKKVLDDRIHIRVGNRGRSFEAFEMIIRGTSVSLAYFTGTKQAAGRVKVSRTGRGGYRSTRSKRASRNQGGQVELIKGRKTTLSRAWLHFGASSVPMVLQRKGRARYPIGAKAAISPATMFNDGLVEDRFTDELMEFLEQRFAHELEYRLKQADLV